MNNGTVTNCNFTNNNATSEGGAVFFLGNPAVTNCNFTGNNANKGSAIYFYSSSVTVNLSNSFFINNRANAEDLKIIKNDNNITITFTGNDNFLNGIYFANVEEFTVTNVTYWSANGITNTGNSPTTLTKSNKEAGQNITVVVIVNDELVLNEVKVTDENGTIVLSIIAGEKYYISARHNTDSYYTEAKKTISNNTNFIVNVTSQTTNNLTVNITAKSNIPNDVVNGKLIFILPNGTKIDATYGANGTWWAEHTFNNFGEFKVNATYVGMDNVAVSNGTITINKVNSTITLDDIVLDYGDSKNATVITTGAIGITAKIGENEAVVDGFVISIPVLDAGTYTLTVTTIPDDDHNRVTKEVTISVNKFNATLTVNDVVLDYGDSMNVTVVTTGAIGITAKIGEREAVVDGFVISIPVLDAGNYTLTVTAIGDVKHNNITKNVTITVNKLKTELTGNKITTTYKINKDLVITLKDSTGKALSGVEVIVDLKGAKTYTTDINGQVKVTTKGLASKVYTAKVTFDGNTNYNKSTKNIKVTVNKAANPLKVKAKTAKVKFLKLKKKSQKLKVRKVVKFTKKGQGTLTYKKVKGNKKITINKKKGKVTIKKGLKKGTYKVQMKIKARGNSNYKASTFKTITFKIKVK